MDYMLKDSYGRKIKSLRISITSKCNQNCIYCHGEGQKIKEKKPEITIDTITKVVSAASSFGVDKVKFSGGEPLVRSDFVDIIASLPKLKDISATTNGILLSKYAYELKEAGLNRVNISLDSLDSEKYAFITGSNKNSDEGKNKLSKVIEGIKCAIEADLMPIKLNMVLLRGINDSEIKKMIEFAKPRSLILQLIELMDFTNISRYQVDISKIENMLESQASQVKCREMHRRKKYFVDGVEVEVVRPIDNSEFCANCSRLRLTSDGKLKPCLLRNDNLVDINGLTEKEICDALKLVVKKREPFYRG